MKLYYSPGVCSLSPHIVLCELGMKYELEKVDLKTKKTETGKDYGTIAEKGAVPLLVLDNGQQLTEGVAIVQYLAEQKPEAGLIPASGLERARVQEWLNFISTELHKGFGPLFNAAAIGPQAVDFFTAKLKKNFDYLTKKLEGKTFLMGDHYTLADAYLFTVLGWTKFIGMDLSPWPVLVEFQKRVASRPAVQQAMKAEGLLDSKAA